MYELDVLVQSYPGKSVCHGGLGWSTIALLRDEGRVILMDLACHHEVQTRGKRLYAIGSLAGPRSWLRRRREVRQERGEFHVSAWSP